MATVIGYTLVIGLAVTGLAGIFCAWAAEYRRAYAATAHPGNVACFFGGFILLALAYIVALIVEHAP